MPADPLKFDKASPEMQNYVRAAAAAYGLPVDVLATVMQSESSFNPHPKDGGKGEIGPMQLLPDTRKTLRKTFNLTDDQMRDPKTNTFLGAYWLRQKIDANQGNVHKGVVAYNGSGPNAETYGTQAMNRLKPSAGVPLTEAQQMLTQNQPLAGGSIFDDPTLMTESKSGGAAQATNTLFDDPTLMQESNEQRQLAEQTGAVFQQGKGGTPTDKSLSGYLSRVAPQVLRGAGNVILGGAKSSLQSLMTAGGQPSSQYPVPPEEIAAALKMSPKERAFFLAGHEPQPSRFQKGVQRAITPTTTGQQWGYRIPGAEAAAVMGYQTLRNLPGLIRDIPYSENIPGLRSLGQMGGLRLRPGETAVRPPTAAQTPAIGLTPEQQAMRDLIGEFTPVGKWARIYRALSRLTGGQGGMPVSQGAPFPEVPNVQGMKPEEFLRLNKWQALHEQAMREIAQRPPNVRPPVWERPVSPWPPTQQPEWTQPEFNVQPYRRTPPTPPPVRPTPPTRVPLWQQAQQPQPPVGREWETPGMTVQPYRRTPPSPEAQATRARAALDQIAQQAEGRQAQAPRPKVTMTHPPTVEQAPKTPKLTPEAQERVAIAARARELGANRGKAYGRPHTIVKTKQGDVWIDDANGKVYEPTPAEIKKRPSRQGRHRSE